MASREPIVDVVVNINYQYDYEDLIKLNMKTPIAGCRWLRPMAVDDVGMEINCLPRKAGDKILMEVNLGDGYFIGIGIDKQENGKFLVVYMDSLEYAEPMSCKIQQEIEDVFWILGAREQDIEFIAYQKCIVQESHAACGLYAYENLKSWAKNEEHLDPGEVALRKAHIRLINDPDFTHKQQHDIVPIRHLEMEQEGELKNKEIQQLTKICKEIDCIKSPVIRHNIIGNFVQEVEDELSYYNSSFGMAKPASCDKQLTTKG